MYFPISDIHGYPVKIQLINHRFTLMVSVYLSVFYKKKTSIYSIQPKPVRPVYISILFPHQFNFNHYITIYIRDAMQNSVII